MSRNVKEVTGVKHKDMAMTEKKKQNSTTISAQLCSPLNAKSLKMPQDKTGSNVHNM